MIKKIKGLAFLCLVSAVFPSFGKKNDSANNVKPPFTFEARFYPIGPPPFPYASPNGAVKPEFILLDSVSCSAGTFVLHALKVDTKFQDDFYRVVLGKIPRGDGKATTLDLTEHLKTFLEGPGNFSEVSGAVDVPFQKDSSLIHVNIWSLISGTGHQSSSSDLIIKDRGDSLTLSLSLDSTSGFAKMNLENSACMVSELYSISNKEGNGILQLQGAAQEKHSLKKKQPLEYWFYAFQKGQFQKAILIQASKGDTLKSRGKKLARSARVVDLKP